MDMREMVDKVKKKEPLYGQSSLSPHLQGVAARNSRFAGVFFYVIPWANFVNHNQVRPPTLAGGVFIVCNDLANVTNATAWCRYREVLSPSRERAGG